MKNLLAVSAGIVLFILGPLTYVDRANEAGAAQEMDGAKTIKGEVLRIEGDKYIVTDITGKPVTLHVNQEVKKKGDIKVGDKIVAEADADGNALSIKRSWLADPCNANPNLPVCGK